MAEAAPPEASAAISPTDVKQEALALEGLDFSMSPEIAMKRPFDSAGGPDDTPDAKRLKREEGAEEESFEDGMSLLVQNALSNLGDLIGQFEDAVPESVPDPASVVPTTEPPATGEAMEIDDISPPPPPPPLPQEQADPITFVSEPERYLRDASLHALGSLSISMLLVVSQDLNNGLLQKISDFTTDHAHSFRNLQQAFEATRRLYSGSSILALDDANAADADFRSIFLLANLAQLAVWVVDDTTDSLREAEKNVLSMLGNETVDIPDKVSDVYVTLKSRLAVESLLAKEPNKTSEDVIKDWFPDDLDTMLRHQRHGQDLSPFDQVLVSSLQLRGEHLKTVASGNGDLLSEKNKYNSDVLLRDLASYIRSRLASANELGKKLGVSMPPAEEPAEPEMFVAEDTEVAGLDLEDLSSFFEKTTSGLVQSALAEFGEETAEAETVAQDDGEAPVVTSESAADGAMKPAAAPAPPTNFITDYKELEALVAESTSNYVKTTLNGLSPTPYQPTVPTSTAENMAAQSNYLSHLHQNNTQQQYYSFAHTMPEPPTQHPVTGENLPPNQSFPSAILYDKARQAALSKTTAHPRREGLHSTRRPWSQEEEKALMAGLDMVKGPHWSQILTLFGQSGTISDILKDRTQVQLKDKARNLKLFFLKTNSEMPYYLQAVTGELKTRAPGQAARKEAEERARLTSEEDQAKLQGIMALSGMQHPAQNRSSGSPAAGAGAGAVAHAQAAAHPTASGQLNGTQRLGVSAATAAALAGVQNRTAIQTTNQQQNSQSVPQAPPRSQNQLPPQVPRPQPQPMPSAQHHAQQAAQQPAAAQHYAGNTNTNYQNAQQPMTNRPSGPVQQHTTQQAANGATSSAATPVNSTQHSQAQQTHHQTSQSPSLVPKSEYPVPQESPIQSQDHGALSSTNESTQQQDDNAAEAALLQGLQAAVASALSS